MGEVLRTPDISVIPCAGYLGHPFQKSETYACIGYLGYLFEKCVTDDAIKSFFARVIQHQAESDTVAHLTFYYSPLERIS
jgi:hypothetical protein